jgi:hypothetical protein
VGYRIRTTQVQGPASYTTTGKVVISVPEISVLNTVDMAFGPQVSNGLEGEVVQVSGNSVQIRINGTGVSGTINFVEVLSGVSLTSSLIRIGVRGY